MSILSLVFFGLCALAAIAGALATVLSRNPIRSAMGLLLMIGAITGLFLTLSAQFLAAIQLIVYAGAVVILFVFVIMLIGPDTVPSADSRAFLSRALGGSVLAFGALFAAVVLFRSGDGLHTFPSAHLELGTIEAFGRELYTRGLLPFELVSILFIVAVIGAVSIARSKNAKIDAPEPAAGSGAAKSAAPAAKIEGHT